MGFSFVIGKIGTHRLFQGAADLLYRGIDLSNYVVEIVHLHEGDSGFERISIAVQKSPFYKLVSVYQLFCQSGRSQINAFTDGVEKLVDLSLGRKNGIVIAKTCAVTMLANLFGVVKITS